MMMIGLFSERTGLKPKTLRYYEEVNLLVPSDRADNGYRQYNESQIELALLISSLRQAGVSVAEIRKFIASDRSGQEQILQRWRMDAQAKMLSLQIANQFLKGFQPQAKHLHLVRWDETKTMIWYPLLSDELQWLDVKKDYIDNLTSLGFTLMQPKIYYVRYSEKEDGFQGEIGFEVSHARELRIDGTTLGDYEPVLFAAIECNPERAAPCQPIFSAISQCGFKCVETPLRQYTADSGKRYTLLVPVMFTTNTRMESDSNV